MNIHRKPFVSNVSPAKQFEKLLHRKEVNEKKAEKAERKLNRSAEAFRKRIASGRETTGDSILDFSIVVRGVFAAYESARALYDFEKKIVGKKGEFFLIVWREEIPRKYEAIVSEDDQSFDLKTSRFLGIFSGEKIVLDPVRRRWGLSTKKYKELNTKRGPSREITGPYMFSSLLDVHCFGKRLNKNGVYEADLEIIVGTESVRASLELQGFSNEHVAMASVQ